MARQKISSKKTKSRKVSKRFSEMRLTVAEGNEYVQQSQKIFAKRSASRKNEPNQVPSNPPSNKKVKKIVKRSKKPARPVRPAQPSVPAVRTSSQANPISRAGSRVTQRVVKTSSKNSVMIQQELHDRLTLHNANIGDLNFSLRWWDPNDLDIHVTCPCGTHINYMQKKCDKCGGQLDIDMNAWIKSSLEPVEHIFFKNPKKGLYKFYVNYFSGPKTYEGVTGGQSSKYCLSLHEGYNQIFRYEDQVSNKQKQIHYDFTL